MAEYQFKEGLPLKDVKRPLLGMRKIIAQRMSESYFTNPVVTLTTEMDMTEASCYRAVWNEKNKVSGLRLSYLDMILMSVAATLRNFPSLNARLEETAIHYLADINLGVAVDMQGKGLVVPVLRNCDEQTLEQLARARKAMTDKVLSGGAELDDLSGGTFTVTNLGSYGIDAFTPIINAPECAILGVGRIVKKPVVVNDEVAIRSRMVLSLTHDHRLNDGGPAAKFLMEITNRLEQPSWMG